MTRHCRPATAQRQRQQGRDAAQLARRRRAERRSRPCAVVRRRRRARHHRAPARRRAPHHGRRRARDRRGAGAAARRASSSTSRAIRGRTCSTLVHEVRPDQCTLVPVTPGRDHQPGRLAARHAAAELGARSCAACGTHGVRVSLFVDPEPAAVALGRGDGRATASSSTPSRSRGRSRAAGRARRRTASRRYAAAATLAHELGLGVNAGHDLDLENLVAVPHAAAPRRSVDRPRADQPRAVRRAGPRGPRLPAALGAVTPQTPMPVAYDDVAASAADARSRSSGAASREPSQALAAGHVSGRDDGVMLAATWYEPAVRAGRRSSWSTCSIASRRDFDGARVAPRERGHRRARPRPAGPRRISRARPAPTSPRWRRTSRRRGISSPRAATCRRVSASWARRSARTSPPWRRPTTRPSPAWRCCRRRSTTAASESSRRCARSAPRRVLMVVSDDDPYATRSARDSQKGGEEPGSHSLTAPGTAP